jgi:uncharacterized iron-regulated membrane protein
MAIPLLLSGLWLWWPSNIAQLKARLQVKRGTSLKRRLYDLHNVLGIYLYSVLFVTTLTGTMLVYQHIQADGGLVGYLQHEQEQTASGVANQRGNEQARRSNTPGTGAGRNAADGSARGGATSTGSAQRGGQSGTGSSSAASGGPAGNQRGGNEAPKVRVQEKRFSEDEILAATRALRPERELTRIQLPRAVDEAVQATFALPIGLSTTESVYLDPYTGNLVQAQASDAPTRSPVRQLTRAFHLGEFGGVASKLIYTVAGLIPLGLFITGVMMWWGKQSKKRSARARKQSADAELLAV